MPQVAKKVVNLSIGDKAPIKHWDTFVIDIKFMHGAGLSYETQQVSLSEADEVIELLNFLERCAAYYPGGKDVIDDYTNVTGYNLFIEGGEDGEDIRPITEIWWPYKEGICSSYDSYKLSYFDKEGQEMQVKLEFDK